jgi:hypothetical protein
MSAGPHKPFLAVWVLFAAGAGLAVLLWCAACDPDLLALAEEAGRDEELGRRSRVLVSALEDKCRLGDDLVAGRLTLREAADRFREIAARQDGGTGRVLRAFPAASQDESFCRHALCYVEAECLRNPELAGVLAGLRAEYRQQFGHDSEPAVVIPQTP